MASLLRSSSAVQCWPSTSRPAHSTATNCRTSWWRFEAARRGDWHPEATCRHSLSFHDLVGSGDAISAASRGSLCGLHPESLRDRGELVADLCNAGRELVRATQIDDLAAHRQP